MFSDVAKRSQRRLFSVEGNGNTLISIILFQEANEVAVYQTEAEVGSSAFRESLYLLICFSPGANVSNLGDLQNLE